MKKQCAECKVLREAATEVVPYSVATKGGKAAERWLCSPSTGRPCAEVWHARYRSWLTS